MTKQQRMGASEAETRTFSIKMPASADRLLEQYCDRTGHKKGEILAKLVRWFVNMPPDVQMVVKEGLTPLSGKHMANMLREMADAIASPEDGEEVRHEPPPPAQSPAPRK
jgi:hypothetical protein